MLDNLNIKTNKKYVTQGVPSKFFKKFLFHLKLIKNLLKILNTE